MTRHYYAIEHPFLLPKADQLLQPSLLRRFSSANERDNWVANGYIFITQDFFREALPASSPIVRRHNFPKKDLPS